MNIHIQESPISSAAIAEMATLITACFGSGSPAHEFEAQVRSLTKPVLVFAEANGRMIGFKLGFEKKTGVFSSWLGGVHPDFRRSGIARKLLRAQHSWCCGNGYKTIVTTSKNEFKGMLILNLSEGFNIIGTELAPGDQTLSILFAKSVFAARD